MPKVQDTYNPLTGEYVKRISDWVILSGDKTFAPVSLYPKFLRADFTHDAPNHLLNANEKITMLDFSSKQVPSGFETEDTTQLHGGNPAQVPMWISNDKTGFQGTSLPSVNEIKAYFYGWKMANADGTSPYYKSEVPYTPATWAEWYKHTASIVSECLTVENNASAVGPNSGTCSFKPSTKYGFLVNIKSNTRTIADTLNTTNNDGRAFAGAIPFTIGAGSTGNKKYISNTASSITANSVNLWFEPNAGKIEIKDFRVFELPTGSQIEADFTNLTADQLTAKYTFNGLCVKNWKKVTDGTGLTSTLPTASYAGYTPYKMIYQLATPEISYLTPKASIPLYDTNTIVETNTLADCKADISLGYKLKSGATAVGGDITAPTPDYPSEVKNVADVNQSDDFFLRTKMIVTDRADSFYASCPNPPLGAVFNNLNTVTNALAPKVVGATDTYMVDTQSVAWAIISLVKLYNKTGNILYLNRAKTVGDYINSNVILASFWGTNFTVMPNRYQYTTATGWVKKTEEISVRNQYLVVYALLMLYKASTTTAYKTTATSIMTTLGYATAQLNSRCGTTDGIATYMAGAQYDAFNYVTETGKYVFSWDTFTHSHADVMVDAIKLYIEQVNNNTLDSSYGVVTPASILSGFATHVKAVQANGKLEMPLIAGLANKLPYSYLSYKGDAVGAGGLMYPTGKNYDWVTTLTWGDKWFANDQCMWTILGFAKLGNYLNDATIKALALAYRNAFLGLKLTSHITYTNVANEVLFYDRYNMNGTPITDDKSVSISATGSFLTLDSELAVNDGALRAKMMYTLGKHQIAQTRNDNKDGGFGWDAVTASYLEVKATGEIWNSPYFDIASKGCKGAKEVGSVVSPNSLTNGNFDNGVTGWIGIDSTISVTDNTLTSTGSGTTASPFAQQSIYPAIGTKMYARCRIRSINSSCIMIRLRSLNAPSTDFSSVPNPEVNTWYTLSGIITPTQQATQLSIRHDYANASTAVGKSIEAQNVQLVDLTQIFGAGNEPTKEQCDVLFANWSDKATAQQATLPTLRKIGAVADSYNPETGVLVQRIGKKVFDGAEAGWNTGVISSSVRRMVYTGLTNTPQNIDSSINNIGMAVSTHLKLIAQGATWTQEVGFTIAGYEVYAFKNNETLDQWKAYLAQQYANGTPVTIYYLLATPVITNLGTGLNLTSFDPTTIINSNSTILPSVTAKYELKAGETPVGGDIIVDPDCVNPILNAGTEISIVTSTQAEGAIDATTLPFDTFSNGSFKTKLTLSSPLRKVGTLADRLFRDTDGIWRVERKVLEVSYTGSENWMRHNYSVTGKFLFMSVSVPLTPSGLAPVTSSHFSEYLGTAETLCEISGTGAPSSAIWHGTTAGTGVYVKIPSATAKGDTANDFKAWLTAQASLGTPLRIQTSLATSTFETLPLADQNKLNALPTFEGETYVYTLAPAKPDLAGEVRVFDI